MRVITEQEIRDGVRQFIKDGGLIQQLPVLESPRTLNHLEHFFQETHPLMDVPDNPHPSEQS